MTIGTMFGDAKDENLLDRAIFITERLYMVFWDDDSMREIINVYEVEPRDLFPGPESGWVEI